jgi:hypothetical protein
MGVDGNEAVLVQAQAGPLRADAVAIGAATHGHEHAIEDVARRRVLTLQGDVEAVVARGDGGDPRAQKDVLVALRDDPVQRPHEVRVGAGHELVEELHDGDARAQRGVDRRHLQADDAAPDHEQAPGNVLELERGGGVHDARIVRKVRDLEGPGARGDDRVLECDRRGALTALGAQEVRSFEAPYAFHHPHLAALREPRQATRELPDHLVLEVADLREIEPRLSELHTALPQCADLGDHLRQVEQRFRRDAAHVEADSPKRRMALHEHDLLAEVGRPERGGVAARPRTEHQHLGPEIRIGQPGPLRPRRLGGGSRGPLARRRVRGQSPRGPCGGLLLRRADAGGADLVRVAHSRRFRMSERTDFRRVVKRTASAPSITRWS